MSDAHQKAMDRWQERYECTLGDASGWCDGKRATRCPAYLRANRSHEEKCGGCELAL